MKIAITGKGGVGKTTISALLSVSFEKAGYKVIAIDADPDSNFASALNFPNTNKIVPLVEMSELIKERVGAEPGNVGMYFKLNPKVDDIPDKYCIKKDNIKLIIMGTIKKAKGGCACPENVFLREVINHVLTERDEVVIMDMEAGIEHLERGTAEGVDAILIISESSKLSIDTSKRINRLSKELKIKKVFSVGNKISCIDEENYIREQLKEVQHISFIPYSSDLRKVYLNDGDLLKSPKEIFDKIKEIREYLLLLKKK